MFRRSHEVKFLISDQWMSKQAKCVALSLTVRSKCSDYSVNYKDLIFTKAYKSVEQSVYTLEESVPRVKRLGELYERNATYGLL